MRSAVALLASVIVVVASPHAATAELLSGHAFVLDGDSIMLDGQRIRILDIDAPENGQLCFKKAETFDRNGWQCGQQAATALSDWIGQQPVTCDTTTLGIHKGWLARCSVAGHDLSEWLAANGWAVPSSRCKCKVVRDASERAKAARLGIWSSNFTMPRDWRKVH